MTPAHSSMRNLLPRKIEVNHDHNPTEADHHLGTKIKGPDNATSQLLPIMSIKGCSRDGEGRKGKGGGEGSRS